MKQIQINLLNINISIIMQNIWRNKMKIWMKILNPQEFLKIALCLNYKIIKL